MEIDIRRAGEGCIDNPVYILADFLAKGVPLRILLRGDQRELVVELLEVAGYKILRERRVGNYVVLDVEKEASTNANRMIMD